MGIGGGYVGGHLGGGCSGGLGWGLGANPGTGVWGPRGWAPSEILAGNGSERAMGDVDERAAGNPSCPKCGWREVNKLAKRMTVQLWQCGKCLDEFTTPLSPAEVAAQAAAAPPLPPPSRPTEEEVLRMAGQGGKCGLCGKPFKHGAWREKHEAKCKGESKSAPSSKAKAVAARIRRDRGLPAAAKVAAGGALQFAVDDLRSKREALVEELVSKDPEVRSVDQAIEALEKIIGGGL